MHFDHPTEDDGDVLVEWRRLEVVVHPVGAGQQVDEVVEPDIQRDRHSDSGPEGVATCESTKTKI